MLANRGTMTMGRHYDHPVKPTRHTKQDVDGGSSPSRSERKLDARALGALFECFEHDGTIRPEVYGTWLGKAVPIRDTDAFAHAKSKLVMFDARTLDHDQIIAWGRKSASAVTSRAVVDAFVESLETRALHRRSALASMALLRHLPLHPWAASPRWHHSPCRVCGEYKSEAALIDLNRLSYTRHRENASVEDIVYAAFDLEVFAAEQLNEEPSPRAWELLSKILDAARSMATKDTAAKLSKAIRSLFPSNERERQQILETLGVCGILQSPDQPGFRTRWINREDRQEPDGKNDWAYPVLWWRGSHGVCQEAVTEWFGHAPKGLLL